MARSIASSMSAELQGIGAYRLVELVAEGARSAFYRATRDGEEGLPAVGLEVLDKAQLADAAEREAFIERRGLAIGLDSPNVVGVREVADADGRPYAITELVDGLPLAALYTKRGKVKLSVPAAGTLVHDIMSALAAANAHAKLVHGRLAADSIWVGHDGLVRVAGFGSKDTGVADFRAVVTLAQTVTPQWPAEVDSWLDELQSEHSPFRDAAEALAGFPLGPEEDGRKALTRLVKRVVRKREREREAAAKAAAGPRSPPASTRAPSPAKRIAKRAATSRRRPAHQQSKAAQARRSEEVAAVTRQARAVAWLCGGLLVVGLLVELFAG